MTLSRSNRRFTKTLGLVPPGTLVQTSPPAEMIQVTGAAAAKVGRHEAAGVYDLRLSTPGRDETREVVVVR
jgi:hypothetical protein